MDNKKIKEVLSLLSINEYDIIGSKADPNIKDEVISDIDAREITFTTFEDILKHFQNIFNILKNNKTIMIIDFKSGYNHLTEKPYRWTYKTIMKGHQYDEENNKINFIDTLKIKSIIKIDTIVNINGEYIEMTMNYYFSFPNHKKTYDNKSNKEILNDLKEDIIEYRDNGNYYKALKRLKSYLKIKGKTDKDLIDIINGPAGIMAKEKSRLETLLYLKNNTKIKIKKTRKDIINRIEELNSQINNNELKSILNNLFNKYK
jgi:hypothetical protein